MVVVTKYLQMATISTFFRNCCWNGIQCGNESKWVYYHERVTLLKQKIMILFRIGKFELALAERLNNHLYLQIFHN